MNIVKLAAAVAVAFTGLAVPAAAQPPRDRDQMEHRDNSRDRDQYQRHDRNARDDNGRHRGWERGRHRGWRNNQRRYRVCRTIWRHHHRQRVCTWRRR